MGQYTSIVQWRMIAATRETDWQFTTRIYIAKKDIGYGIAAFRTRLPCFKNGGTCSAAQLILSGRPFNNTNITGLPKALTALSNSS